MLRRIFVSAFLAAAMGLGCGGGELPADSGNGTPEQDKAGLLMSCDTMQNRVCNPLSEGACVYGDGTLGECYCQDIPFNRWVCMRPTL